MVHIFLWVLANNKTLTTGDNPARRRVVEDGTCMFCSEQESVKHLFFDCCIGRWISEITGVDLGSDFEFVGKLWVQGKKFELLNVLSSAALCTLWKYRNSLCFQDRIWRDLRELAGECARMLRDWRLLQKTRESSAGWLGARARDEEIKTSGADLKDGKGPGSCFGV
jgi:hypothetical protein